MIKNLFSLIAAVITAFALSYSLNDDPLANFKFQTGIYNASDEEKAVEYTLNEFNRHFATLFNAGGDLRPLNYIPAENLIKRRIVQEINEWRKNDKVLVYDKDVFEIEEIEFHSPVKAVAIATEVWFLNVQSRQKRHEKSGVKASPIKVRYILEKHAGRWKVVEFEVFGRDDTIPPYLQKGGF